MKQQTQFNYKVDKVLAKLLPKLSECGDILRYILYRSFISIVFFMKNIHGGVFHKSMDQSIQKFWKYIESIYTFSFNKN